MKKTVSQNKYSRYINSCSGISNVQLLDTDDIIFELQINDEVYSIMFISLCDHKLPTVFLCNPDEGRAKKPHQLYLKKYGLIHLCLSVREDISVKNNDYKYIIDYTLKRIIRLLSLTPAEEKREFRKEFLYFWNRKSKNDKKVKVFVNSSKDVKKLKLLINEKSFLIMNQSGIKLNEYFMKKYSFCNEDVIYIPVVNSNDIIPPVEEEHWNIDVIKYIFNNCIGESNVNILEKIQIRSKEIYLVFEMKVTETLPVTFLLKLEFKQKKDSNIFDKVSDIISIEHLSSQRCESDYLYKRIGVKNNSRGRKVLLVGAGSLGSYITSELPKLGVESITIFDNDKLSVENIMRHKLGVGYTGVNKAFGMKFELESSFPQVKIEYRNEKFNEDKIDTYALKQYDIIVIATGGTDFMLNLNRNLKKALLQVPVMFCWIEANGVGIHALVVDYNKKGCYKCLYSESNYNKAHFSNESNKTTLIGTGCGSVFNSYGNLALLKGSTMILEIIQAQLEHLDENKSNPLYSIRTTTKNDGNYIISRRDFKTSKNFYVEEGCDVCGTSI